MFLKTGLRTILCVAAPETKSDFSPAKSDFGLQVRRTEKVLLVTFVTHDKSNPSGADGQKPLAQPGTLDNR